MSISSFKDLIVWQKSIDLVEKVYETTKAFPKEEIYALTNQIRRAAVSVPSNIAEGHARKSTAEFRNFLSIARGSLAEAETQFIVAHRLNYVTQQDLRDLQTEINKMINALIKKLASRI